MDELTNRSNRNEAFERDKKKYSSNQLWIRICIIIIADLIFALIWCFTARTDSDFISHFSFASTVTSIILSVLAIFMSVTGESKTQVIRDRIEEEADDIVKVTNKLEDQIKDLSEKLTIVVYNTDNIKAAISEPREDPQVISGSETSGNETRGSISVTPSHISEQK